MTKRFSTFLSGALALAVLAAGFTAAATQERDPSLQYEYPLVGDSDDTTRTMKNLVNLGDALGLLATPSFIVCKVAILGFPGQHELQAITDAAAGCGKVMC